MSDILKRLKSALASRYTIERELGAGGMATVYLAQDLKHDRNVAIKLLRPDLGEVIGADRFLREIEIAARLQHPHIVPLYDSGNADGLLYYVMPYVEGDSLRDRLDREGELPIPDTVKILRDVADALADAHVQGIVHRDVKPDNVMFRGEHAVVTDFGVGKAVSDAADTTRLTTAGIALGTPMYMAPEQATADPNADHRVDIYALGVIGYEMLAGELPFSGGSAQAVLAAHVTETPEPIAVRRAATPEALASLVMRCLEKEPLDRWQSAAEVRSALDAIHTQGSVEPRQVAGPPKRRTPMIVGAVVLMTIVIALGFTFLRSNEAIPSAAARTMVAPFAPTTPDSALGKLGRNLVVTLSTNLDGVGGITVIDPLTVLGLTKDGSAPSLDEAATLASRLEVLSFIHGTVIGSGTNVRLDAGMYSVEDRSPLVRVAVSGPMDDLGALTDSLTWAILRHLWRGSAAAPTPSIEAVTTSSMDALRAFLDGEELTSRHAWLEAAEAYARAIAADSTFWLAYWRHARARDWFFVPVDSVIRAGYREHRFELPERERLLIDAQMARSFRERLAVLEQAVGRFPGYWPAWMEYGDRLSHWGGFMGYAPNARDAALRRVIDLNPTFAPAWNHLAANNNEWNPQLADSAWRRAHALGSSGFGDVMDLPEANPLIAQWFAELLRDGSPSDSLVAAILAASAERLGFGIDVQFVRAILKRNLGGLPAATRIAARFPNEPHHIDLAAQLYAQRGAWDSALVRLRALAVASPADSNPMHRASGVYTTVAALAWLGAIDTQDTRWFRTQAVSAATRALDSAQIVWADAVVSVANEDAPALERVRARVPRLTSEMAPDIERSLAAFASGMAGDPSSAADSLAALEWERAATDRRWEATLPMMTIVNRLAASRWLAAQGEAAEALRLSHWVETWTFTNEDNARGYVHPLARLEQGRIAEQLGQRDAARFYYQAFLNRHDMPQPRNRHLIEEAETAVARLVAESGR